MDILLCIMKFIANYVCNQLCKKDFKTSDLVVLLSLLFSFIYLVYVFKSYVQVTASFSQIASLKIKILLLLFTVNIVFIIQYLIYLASNFKYVIV